MHLFVASCLFLFTEAEFTFNSKCPCFILWILCRSMLMFIYYRQISGLF